MKHVIVGGDGFVGRYIARDLLDRGEQVVICDINQSDLQIYDDADFLNIDISDPAQVSRIPIAAEDIVYNTAARMLHPIVKRKDRREYFFSVDFEGAKYVVDHALDNGCNRLIQFSTDMVYGLLQTEPPAATDHPRVPIGEYSDSKLHIEDYCMKRREDGLNVSIFRPRLIIGPGRLGVLAKLFGLIHRNLPVPMIGTGSNRYQMVSVFDCASAAIMSADKGVVDGEFNLGSEAPPTVRNLLRGLINSVNSRSLLVPTPATLLKLVLRGLDKIDLSLMVPEQYEVADKDYVIDIAGTKEALGWSPRHSDEEMLRSAYDEYLNAGREQN